MKKFELMPNNQKSFYGKAVVTEYSENLVVLTFYKTEVARIEKGVFVRMWGGYSATTMKHVNAFVAEYGVAGGGKKWWDALPVDNSNIITEIINAVV